MAHKENELIDLVEPIDLSEEDTYICLTQGSLQTIKDLLTEWKHKEKFAAHNLPMTNKILLFGESGNGKTTLAKFIARKAELPMLQVKQEQVISAYIGDTGKYIATVFEQVDKACVLFWDEIDGISYSRSLSDRKGGSDEEYNKALNVLLVKMERMDPNVIFIGATNRPECIDSAVLRRFDLKHEMPAPGQDDKIKFMLRMFRHYDMPNDELHQDILELNSFSDIKNAVKAKCRKAILNSIYNK